MKKIYILSIIFLSSISLTAQFTATTYRGAFEPAPTPMWTDSWTNYDPDSTVYPATTVTVSADISVNTIWSAANVYNLSGQVYVVNGATLTIEAGTVIRGDINPALKSALIITRGSKIIAEGTAANPIVFTSGKVNGQRQPGDWGGIVLLGRGKFNSNNGFSYVEGFAPTGTTDVRTKYGADTSLGEVANDADNSGTLKYVRIEFGGVVLAPNNEINGLTFGAVGSGTTIDYVQCSFTNDDSFEWFGGAVNCKHLVAYRGIDDDFDTDNGYSGKVQFCLGVRDPLLFDPTFGATSGGSTSEGFESDNNATGTIDLPLTSALFTNVTMVGPTKRSTLAGGTLSLSYKRAARIRRNSALKICNSIFLDYVEGLHVDNGSTAAPNGGSETNVANGSLVFKNNIVAGITTSTKIAFINSSGNHPTPALDIPNWFTTLSNNTGLASPITSANILTKPYDAVGTVYTGLDYRPATGSIALTGADFSDAAFTGTLSTANANVLDKKNVFKVYPSAFSSTFKLSFNTENSKDATVSVYNVQGQLVESREISANNINTEDFGASYSAGVYLVKLTQGTYSHTVRAIKK